MRDSGLQRRREPRSAVAPFLEVELFDGMESREGRLTNISGHGIGIETGRDSVAQSCSQIEVLVRSCNRQMRITAEPRWQRTVVPGVVAMGCFVPGMMPDMYG